MKRFHTTLGLATVTALLAACAGAQMAGKAISRGGGGPNGPASLNGKGQADAAPDGDAGGADASDGSDGPAGGDAGGAPDGGDTDASADSGDAGDNGNGNGNADGSDGAADGDVNVVDDASGAGLATEDGHMSSPKVFTSPFVQGAQNVPAANCTGTYAGGYCSGVYVRTIRFDRPFKGIPKVLVSPASVSDQGSDIGGATDRVVAFADNVTPDSFRMVCSGSPKAGTHEGWSSIGACSWIAIGDVETSKAQTVVAQAVANIVADDCAAGSGGYCASGYYKDIVFERPFDAPPKVLVTAGNVSHQGGDIGGTTDRVVSFATQITAKGFRMWCSGSPVNADIGKYEGWSTIGMCSYVAVANVQRSGPSLHVEGAQNVLASKCKGSNTGGYCSGTYYSDVKFSRSFATKPVVIATAAVISQQGGAIGGATDKVYVLVEKADTQGFRLHCSGSPKHGSSAGYEGHSTVGACSWLAIDGASTKQPKP